MNEIWKDVVGYEGIYQVSNYGNVKRNDKDIKGCINGSGRMIVLLYKNGVRSCKYVHRLVGESFIPNPNQYPQINHKDENPLNNCVENLEWCTCRYNNTYGTRIKRAATKTSKKVGQYDSTGNLIKIWPSVMECARCGYSQSSISLCCRGKKENYKKFIWKYE